MDEDMHGPQGNWPFYVIVPGMVSGVVGSFWLIIKGALGLFGRTRPKEPSRQQ